VLLFAQAADAAGVRESVFDVPARTTVGTVVDELCAQYPRLNPLRSTISIAVNEVYASLDAELREGDTMAIIPPVSGG